MLDVRGNDVREERDDAQLLGPRQIAVLTTAVAFAASLVYLLTAAVKMYVLGGFANVSRDVIWMSPLSNLFWYFAGWLALVGLMRVIGGRRGVSVAVWALFTVFTFSLFLRFTQIHRIAALIFSFGLASVVTGRFNQAPGRWVTRARTAAIGLGAAFLVASVLFPLRRAVMTAELPRAAGGLPNVLLIVMDAVRGDMMQSTGYARAVTPFLDSLATTGLQFSNAYSTAPWTLPSHGSMFTGEYPGRLNGTFRIPLDDTHPYLGERFSALGYYTFGMTGNLHYTSWEAGIGRGFREWHDYERSVRQVLRSSDLGQVQMILEIIDADGWSDVAGALRRHSIYVSPKPEAPHPVATEMTDRFLSWHAERPDRPYLAFVNYYDAHFPYVPPERYRRRFTESPSSRDLYDGEVSYVDDEMRRLIETLAQRDALNNTYIIITSDHGELFGEGGKTTHGNGLLTPVLHVPLIIVGPGLPRHRVDQPVTLRDIPATIVQLTGAETSFPGASLTGYLTDSTYRSSPVLAWYEAGDVKQTSMTAVDYHLIQSDDSTALYHYSQDPLNEVNLIAIDTLTELLHDLGNELQRALEMHAGAAPRSENER